MSPNEDDRDAPPPPLSIEFRPVPGFPRHSVGSDLTVWFNAACPGYPPPWDKPRWARLRSFPLNGAGRFVHLRHEGREHVRSVELLRRAAFSPHPRLWLDRVGPKPPRVEEGRLEEPPPVAVYRPVPGFQGYRMGSDRSVWSCWVFRGRGRWWTVSDPPVWRLIPPGVNRVVRLTRGGEKFAFSLRQLFGLVFPDAGEVESPPAPPIAPDPAAAVPEPVPAEPYGPRPDFRPVPDFPGEAFQPESVARPQPLPEWWMRGEPSVGSAHGRAKLDEAKVAEARRLKREGWTYPELVKRYGVGKVTLFYAVSGRTWRHVPMEPGPG